MKKGSCHIKSSQGGFTLLEMVVALAIGAAVLVSVFMLADAAVKTTSVPLKYQEENLSREAFFDYLKEHFETMPGDAMMQLNQLSESSPFQPELIFQNVPVSLNWGGRPISAKAVRLFARVREDKRLDVVMEYYERNLLDDPNDPEGAADFDQDPLVSLVLLEGLGEFDWEVFDGRGFDGVENRTRTPYNWDWANLRRMPTFLKLAVRFPESDIVVRRTFWIPKKENPRNRIRQTMTRAGNNRFGEESTGSGSGSGTSGGPGGAVPGVGSNNVEGR